MKFFDFFSKKYKKVNPSHQEIDVKPSILKKTTKYTQETQHTPQQQTQTSLDRKKTKKIRTDTKEVHKIKQIQKQQTYKITDAKLIEDLNRLLHIQKIIFTEDIVDFVRKRDKKMYIFSMDNKQDTNILNPSLAVFSTITDYLDSSTRTTAEDILSQIRRLPVPKKTFHIPIQDQHITQQWGSPRFPEPDT